MHSRLPSSARRLTIAGRAIEITISSNGVGDLYRIYTTAKRDHIEFRLAVIGDDFKDTAKDHFDKSYMIKLFDYARSKGRAGYAWNKAPPGLKG